MIIGKELHVYILDSKTKRNADRLGKKTMRKITHRPLRCACRECLTPTHSKAAMIQSGGLGCAEPAALAALAGHSPLVANMSGFKSSGFTFPTTQVFVHPPERDRIISAGLLQSGQWAHKGNEATRRKIVGMIARVLSAAPGTSFLDLGANIGTFSMPLLAAGFRGLLFEAMPANAWLLRASVCALGATTASIFAPIALGSHSGGSACMQILKASNSGAAAAMLDDGAGCAAGARVPVATLDSLVDCRSAGTRVAAMKMDVEGSEVAVMQGAMAFLSRCRPASIFVEVNKFFDKAAIIAPRSSKNRSSDMMRMLTLNGYVVKQKLSHHDYHFVLQH